MHHVLPQRQIFEVNAPSLSLEGDESHGVLIEYYVTELSREFNHAKRH